MKQAIAAAILLGATLQPAPAPAQINFMSAAEEQRIGDTEHPKILSQFGGVVEDPELGAYVAGIAVRMAANSDNPKAEYRVTLLNSPVVNAFALPGGYVYLTRGILSLANNEAEVAGVIGHEIGHVTAHHTAQRYSQGVMSQVGTQIGAIAASIFLGQAAGQLVGQLGSFGSAAYLQSFSRENEYEADLLGVKSLARAGYAPMAQAAFLQSLGDHSALEGRIAGQAGKEREMDLFASHPRTVDRVQRAIREAAIENPSQIYRREEFLRATDGMIYGDDPKQGFVKGRRFEHPGFRLAFEVPEGFRIVNTDAAVIMPGPSKSVVQFDGDDRGGSFASISDYLTRSWSGRVSLMGSKPMRLNLGSVETFTVGGLPAATGITQVQTNQGNTAVRLVAIGFGGNQVYRFALLAPGNAFAGVDAQFKTLARSFRKLSEEEASAIKPLRIRVATVREGDTLESLAARMHSADFRLERFKVINGLREGEVPQPGQKVKLVAE